MSTIDLEQALENIYTSLHNNNENLDSHIDALKSTVAPAKEVTIDATRLPVPNREGRKIMQTYFKKRGLSLNFANKEAPAASA